MAEEDVLLIVGEQEILQREVRLYNRSLRDTSDPFSVPEENFRKFFRLSREACRDLFTQISPYMKNSLRSDGLPKIFRMMAALHFFAHGSYQKSVGKDSYAVLSQSSVSRSLIEICNIIVDHFVDVHIKFPTAQVDVERIKRGFFDKYNFSGVIGAIDCTHIAITPPPADHPDQPGLIFINRKNFHSLNCQIICDSDLNILSLNAQFPGSVHDSAIWMMSSIKTYLLNNYRNGNNRTWLIGDSGYPLQPFLFTPIVHADPNTPEGRYTRHHIRARNCVERCIGVLKSYFRCLLKDRTLHYSPLTAGKIVYTCAVLHNILIRRRLIDPLVPDIVVDNVDDNENRQINNADVDVDLLAEGRNLRNRYIRENFN